MLRTLSVNSGAHLHNDISFIDIYFIVAKRQTSDSKTDFPNNRRETD